jgi:GAF domain-containing protein
MELAAVAQVTLEEASRLIKGTGGLIVLLDEESRAHKPVAAFGWDHGAASVGLDDAIVGAVLATARAEIINNVPSDVRFAGSNQSPSSMICAPLMSKKKAIGVILLVSDEYVTYTAADLNLLNTLASQAAPAIENALLYERTLREAQEREERLRKQVHELRIDLDKARQQEKVTEITESDHFQRLRDQADSLRSIIGGE